MRAKRNYSYAKGARLINGIIKDTLNQMANHVNESIQRGIDNKRDVNGKPFKPLSTESTLPIRNFRGQGFTPLDTMKSQRARKLRNTKIKRATLNKLASKIFMNTEYGVYHNEGFTTGSKSMIPNKKVPARNWFGIPKDMAAGGKSYENFIRLALFQIKRSLLK